jgi:hypothetical protein
MKLAYLILAHNNFEQLTLLINQLTHPDVSFFIHIDSKVDDSVVQNLVESISNENTHFLEYRVKINWGGFSIFKAIHDLITKAIGHNKYDYLSLISGQDFPIKSNKKIIDDLSYNLGKEFISYHPLPYKNWAGNGGLDRINYFWLIDDLGWQNAHVFATNQFLGKATRQFPRGLAPYGGSMWFTITTECATYITHYLSNNPDVLVYFRYVMIPDELIIPTLVLNSKFKDKVINDNLRYADWSTGAPHPKTLTVSDLPNLIASSAHIARKFDDTIDKKIISKVIENLLE